MPTRRMRYLMLALVLAGTAALPHTSDASAAVVANNRLDQTHPLVNAAFAAVANQPASPQLQAAVQSAPLNTIALVSTPTKLQREVFGFVNAGNLGDPTVGYTSWNFNLLSTVAYFGLQVNSGDGALVQTNTGWAVYHSSTMTSFVNAAHAAGTRVIVSLNLH
ncbi:MAG TPA: hypothetical protein VNU19_13005, partial [Candidatus Acidoferrum sp.]|nr:hypothetical protein [Candidatus Acidoferrum sp.]